MKIFVSYSRANKTEVEKIVDLLKLEYEVFWDADITSMSTWWAKILDEIEKCDIFIFVISEESVGSEYCLAELDYARDRNRPILPFVIDAPIQYTIPDNLQLIQWYIYDKDNPADLIRHLRNSINKIDKNQYRDIKAPRPPVPRSSEESIIKQFQKAVNLAKNGEFDKANDTFAEVKGLDFQKWGRKCIEWIERINAYDEIYQLAGDESTHREAIIKWRKFVRRYDVAGFDPHGLANRLPVPKFRLWYIILVIIIFVMFFVLVFNITGNDDTPTATLTPSDTPTDTLTATITPTATLTPSDTPTDTPTATITPTATLTPSDTPTDTLTATITPTATLTPSDTPTDTLTATITPTATLTPSDTPTDTPTATITPTYTTIPLVQIQLANTPVVHNQTWTPVEYEFDGVMMVLVPAGCFMMGSETGENDERPVHQQCFNRPFWIDKYEVTNGQFREFGGVAERTSNWTEDNVPREGITWFEARDFCALRGGRLPTEAEWEYAARGPNNWVYPWGDRFVESNVVYRGNSNRRTAPVGSRPGGASWVGAMDMSGNVWEWVSSLYQSYPYDGDDEQIDDIDSRVLRGGSWIDFENGVRSAFRGWNTPVSQNMLSGFRCVRSE